MTCQRTGIQCSTCLNSHPSIAPPSTQWPMTITWSCVSSNWAKRNGGWQGSYAKPYKYILPSCVHKWLADSYHQIFKHSTLFFLRDTPSISTVILAMDHINEYLATASQDPLYSEAIHATLALGKWMLNQYSDKTDHSEVYRIAMDKSPHIQSYFCVFN